MEETENKSYGISKGTLIAIILAIAAVVIVVSLLFGYKSTSQYQGFIKKIEEETQKLEKSQPGLENPLSDNVLAPF